MKLKLKSILAVVTMALCSVTAAAQDAEISQEGGYLAESQELGYLPYPYTFIQAQGGVGTTFADVSAWKLFSPTFSLAVGRMFTPIFGARIHVNGWKAKGGFDSYYYRVSGRDALISPDYDNNWDTPTHWEGSYDDDLQDPDNYYRHGTKLLKYNYNYINTDVDLMVNIFNIFKKKVHRPFDLYFIGGIGLNYAWHNNDFERITSQVSVTSDISNAWGKNQTPRHNLLSHNLRLGLLADVNVGKNFSVGAEVDFNSLDDRFNSKYKDADDWMMTAQLSLTYKFGFRAAPKPTPVAVTATPVYQDTKQTEVAPATAPTPVVVQEPVKETIFYAIRESDVDKASTIDKVATWCKKYPNKTITISGYADKGTGNPQLNAGYAKQRADKVAAMLLERGVPASQMTVNSYGDTVQPFPADNDKNRCVIIEGK